MTTFGVVLDANVLVPAVLRDTLLTLAHRGVFRVHWSQEILDETRRALLRQGMMSEAQADHLFGAIQGEFEDAIVEDYQQHLPDLTIHDSDRHVLAAAIRSGARTIVTSNLRHFPAEVCSAYNIDVHSPDEFLCRLYRQNSRRVFSSLEIQAMRLARPPLSLDEMLRYLEVHTPAFANLVRKYQG